MGWFKRTKSEYLDDLDWIENCAKTFFRILAQEPDADNLKLLISQEFPEASEVNVDTLSLNMGSVLTRCKGSTIALNAQRESPRDKWRGIVSGYDRYFRLDIHGPSEHVNSISVSVTEPPYGERAGAFAKRARDDLAKRAGFDDMDDFMARMKRDIGV